MHLYELKNTYDIAISLGAPCQTAEQLRRHDLRTFSGPFDWSVLESVECLVRALNTRFENFFLRENLIVDGEGDHYYLIYDTYYEYMSVHDFPLVDHPDQIFDAYPAFIEKIQRRINRFYEKVEKSKLTLFVRYHADFEETKLLQKSLAALTKNRFVLLVLNESDTAALVEEDWNLENTCALQIKQTNLLRWSGYDPHWDIIFDGVSVKDKGLKKITGDPVI